ncbi:MAG: hypothetical protein IT436_09035 [Phycisphaerales bacterium]|nr:hypothetical protein [Phycisphaerales bacterium]
MKTSMTLLALAGFASAASAGIGVETYSTAAPPATVHGHPVVPATFDDRLFSDVISVPHLPFVSGIDFSSPVNVRRIGFGWATWSHGYTGNVYYTNGATSITMIPWGWAERAFQFYAEPNPFGVFQMTATGSDGSTSTSSTEDVDGGGGAFGWGFYGVGPTVRSVTVSADIDFAVGELASFPAPASLCLFALAGLAAGRQR